MGRSRTSHLVIRPTQRCKIRWSGIAVLGQRLGVGSLDHVLLLHLLKAPPHLQPGAREALRALTRQSTRR